LRSEQTALSGACGANISAERSVMTSKRIVLLIVGVLVASMLWKEYPAMVRYYKIQRM
jgi:hypothetical protein